MNQNLIIGDILNHIHTIRGVQVMSDFDLAILYGTSTMRLNEQVKRNKARFPEQYCFQLTKLEISDLISQFAISNKRGGRRSLGASLLISSTHIKYFNTSKYRSNS